MPPLLADAAAVLHGKRRRRRRRWQAREALAARQHHTEKIQQILIKYSKYVYRIVFCLDKIKIKNEHQTLENLKKVLKLRKTLDLKKANLIGAWKILHPEVFEITKFTKLGIFEWLESMKKVYLDLFQTKITELYKEEDLKIEKETDLIYLSDKKN